MEWTEIKMYDNAFTYWVSGIYKVVSYEPDTFFAYYIVDGCKNWGDHPSTPPVLNFRKWRCWNSLESAQQACENHSKIHTPKPKTIARAAELKAEFLEAQ
jgi:hypothetical protein